MYLKISMEASFSFLAKKGNLTNDRLYTIVYAPFLKPARSNPAWLAGVCLSRVLSLSRVCALAVVVAFTCQWVVVWLACHLARVFLESSGWCLQETAIRCQEASRGMIQSMIGFIPSSLFVCSSFFSWGSSLSLQPSLLALVCGATGAYLKSLCFRSFQWSMLVSLRPNWLGYVRSLDLIEATLVAWLLGCFVSGTVESLSFALVQTPGITFRSFRLTLFSLSLLPLYFLNHVSSSTSRAKKRTAPIVPWSLFVVKFTCSSRTESSRPFKEFRT